jgi:type I restriction enzyme S subunit
MVMSDLPNGKALAKTFIADKGNFYAVNQRVCALTPRENHCSRFLAFVLDRNPYFLKFDDGVNQTHLLNRVFEKCSVDVPSAKTEQTAIATVLSDMDTEIESLESKLAKAREIKQGMMQELLTGKIRLVKSSAVSANQQEMSHDR